MMARMTPVSLHFSDVPTGWKKKIFTDKQQLATGFACSSRTVSPDEHCYRLICASCTQFHVPLGTQAFQLPQAASKQRSVPWCCRCGMFAAFTTAAIRLLRSIFIWAPPRTRPKFQHLCEHRKIFQPVSRMLILEIHNAVVAVPADVTSLGCHCPPNIFYASDCFFDIFHMMMTKVWYSEIPRHAYLFAWFQNNAMTCLISKQNWTVQHWTVQIPVVFFCLTSNDTFSSKHHHTIFFVLHHIVSTFS